jgi:hypothetical protein
MGVIGDHDLLACETKVDDLFPFVAARSQGRSIPLDRGNPFRAAPAIPGRGGSEQPIP